MKLLYVLVQKDSVIGYIYEHKKFGKVFVFDKSEISLKTDIEVFSIDAEPNEVEKVNVLEAVLSHLGISK